MTKSVAQPPISEKDWKSRRRLLNALKMGGPQDANALGQALGISAMAVRQHLYTLQEQEFVTFETVARGRGRPAKAWRLTPAANQFFPDAHRDLSVELIADVRETFGAVGLKKLVTRRFARQLENYRSQISDSDSLSQRLRKLVAIRSAEGYMAQVLPQPDGGYLLVENHCPICEAATACAGICAAELDLFDAVLAPAATVERRDHILAGARRCAYDVKPSDKETGI